MKISLLLVFCLLIKLSFNSIILFKFAKTTFNWVAEEFLTVKFKNKLGSHCYLVAKNEKIKGEYLTKNSRGKLIQPGFPIRRVYTPVKDDILLTMIVTFKIEGDNQKGLERFSQCVLEWKSICI